MCVTMRTRHPKRQQRSHGPFLLMRPRCSVAHAVLHEHASVGRRDGTLEERQIDLAFISVSTCSLRVVTFVSQWQERRV